MTIAMYTFVSPFPTVDICFRRNPSLVIVPVATAVKSDRTVILHTLDIESFSVSAPSRLSSPLAMFSPSPENTCSHLTAVSSVSAVAAA